MKENFKDAVAKEASKILINRKEKLKKIEETKKARELERKNRAQYGAFKILQVFEASNSESESDLLVWKVRVKSDGETLDCFFSFSPDEDASHYLAQDGVTPILDTMPQVKEAINDIQKLEPNDTIINDMYDLLTNLPGFQVSQQNLVVELKMLK